ncbi:hypothetical protein N7532_006206 [Penicillium argentinense]|uniref:Uncharacterized protein n=1 Tax=Penicillium argentinense TaxID=1131581 RepID=A0A9W9FFM7_9EURO|nr:uncharacterized protein N7532_006206 [Penicillium argentinense]KAJ5099205.1 hypothetical protein N7532_006206 [Penicillium argentinense]
MLRASLRPALGPVRGHVCYSCLAVQSNAPARFRQLHTTPVLNAKERKDKSGKSRKIVGKPSGKLSEKKSKHARNDSQDADKSQKSAGNNQHSQEWRVERNKAAVLRVTEALNVAKQRQQEQEKPSWEETNEAKELDNSTLKHVAKNVDRSHSGTLTSWGKEVLPLDIPTAPVPGLSFGLDRVLFNPGVYHLRDPRSRVYNFDPYLDSIMPVTEFDFNTLKEYITSSKDTTLRDVAVKEKKKYVGSSSSMTSVLSHFHYLLSSWRGVDTRTVSRGFPETMKSFTRLLRSPAAMFLHYQDGVYAIDADKEFDSANILMNLGKSMEKLLTLPKEDFERYRRSHENKISPEEEEAIPESYHYSTYGDFVMRSQLDAYDPRLPGTGMFDLKTRAVVSIRMDSKNFEQGMGYEIKDRFGAYESYEREFYDMIRAAFLKYSLQVRIGRMDGIFVAFHNVERIFGFQYVSLPEMDQALHGQTDTSLGDTEFQLSLGLWNKVLDRATEKFPGQSLRFHFDTRDTVTPFMYIFAEPVTQEEIHAIQNKNKAEVEEYQKRLLNLMPKEDGLAQRAMESAFREPEGNDAHEKKIDEAEADKTESQESSDVYDSSLPPDETFDAGESDIPEPKAPLLAMTLTTRNIVNGKAVDRPENFTKNDEWSLQWQISELNETQGRQLYKMCQARREKALAGRGEDELDLASNIYIRKLQKISQDGRKFREKQKKRDAEQGVVVYKSV